MRSLTAPSRRNRGAEELPATARELAERIQSPHAAAVSVMISGVLAYLQGQWKTASARCDEAEAVLRSQCTNVAWELSLCTVIATIGRQASGEWERSVAGCPVSFGTRKARGDLNASLSLRLLALVYVMDVAENQPDRALNQLRRDRDSRPVGPVRPATGDIAAGRGGPGVVSRPSARSLAGRGRAVGPCGAVANPSVAGDFRVLDVHARPRGAGAGEPRLDNTFGATADDRRG